jgi:hypothetical protein
MRLFISIICLVLSGCEGDFKEIIEKNNFFADKDEEGKQDGQSTEEQSLGDEKVNPVKGEKKDVEVAPKEPDFADNQKRDLQVRGNQSLSLLKQQLVALEEKNQKMSLKHKSEINLILRKHQKELARMRQEVVKADAAGYQRGIDEMLKRRARAKGEPPSEE